jgi:hypothetical protein
MGLSRGINARSDRSSAGRTRNLVPSPRPYVAQTNSVWRVLQPERIKADSVLLVRVQLGCSALSKPRSSVRSVRIFRRCPRACARALGTPHTPPKCGRATSRVYGTGALCLFLSASPRAVSTRGQRGVAHEIAHHDLGHLAHFGGPFARRAAGFHAGMLAVLFFRSLQKRIYSPEKELAADRRAIDLCLAAGYDPGKCLYSFHILELIALYYGDLGAVYGLDTASDHELSPDASPLTKARIWLYQRERGYLPIQDRQAELRRYVVAKLASRSNCGVPNRRRSPPRVY